MVKALHKSSFLLVSQVEAHAFHAFREFLEGNNAITVFVKLGEEVDYVLLERGVVLAGLLDLADDVLDGGFGELIGVVVHVFFGVVISRQKLELESTEEASAANQEILLGVVGLSDGAEMLLALHEFTSDSSGVLVADFVNLDGVITAEEGDNELSGFIIRLSGDQLGVEAEDVHVLLEHLLHVNLGGLSSQMEDTVHGVFLGTVAGVRGDSLVDKVGTGFAESNGVLGHVQVASVPLLGEIIGVVNEAVTAVNGERHTALEVLRQVIFFSSERHSGAVSENGRLSESLSLEEHGEGVASTVLDSDLLDLKRVVGEEVVQSVVLVTTIVSLIFPEDGEREHLSVVLEERVEVSVGTATTKSDFVVVLHLSLIWRILFEVNHFAGLLVRIIGKGLRVSEVDALVGVEGLGEIVTVVYAEHSGVNREVHGHGEISPGVALSRASVLGNFMALKENTLGKTSVLLSIFDDVDGVIVQVVHHGALVDTEVLSLGLNNGLLEVDAESQDLSIVLKPLGSDLWDGIVLMGGALRYASVRHSCSETHGIEHFLVDGFLETLCLF